MAFLSVVAPFTGTDGGAWKRTHENPVTHEERLAYRRELRKVARGDGNLLYPIKDALGAGGSIGEVCNAMRDVFGEYRGGAFF